MLTKDVTKMYLLVEIYTLLLRGKGNVLVSPITVLTLHCLKKCLLIYFSILKKVSTVLFHCQGGSCGIISKEYE